jgi:TrmH RNA methyltransferase
LAAVAALFERAPARVQRLFFEERNKQAAGAWCALLAATRRPYRMVGLGELTRIAGTPMHGGVVALATPRPVLPLDARESSGWVKDGKPLLLLDGIGNPQNLGAIVRTAAFFGITKLVLSDHLGQALPSDAAYRISEGGLEHMAVFRSVSFVRDLRALRAHYLVVGTAATGGVFLSALKQDARPVALVLGNEEHGLSRATLAACEAVVTLAGEGAVQSLNVAATAAILLHALVSRHR